jgi:hypothetical protein
VAVNNRLVLFVVLVFFLIHMIGCMKLEMTVPTINAGVTKTLSGEAFFSENGDRSGQLVIRSRVRFIPVGNSEVYILCLSYLTSEDGIVKLNGNGVLFRIHEWTKNGFDRNPLDPPSDIRLRRVGSLLSVSLQTAAEVRGPGNQRVVLPVEVKGLASQNPEMMIKIMAEIERARNEGTAEKRGREGERNGGSGERGQEWGGKKGHKP